MKAKKKERAELEATGQPVAQPRAYTHASPLRFLAVRKIFNSYDVDRNGYLDAGEFNAVKTPSHHNTTLHHNNTT